ncbi:MAG: hypothetical protein AUG51_16940 [Acidobacteria bacterium 13_1_20CM_3_53_8]|nr:MAG: hypothetical protein AUG51_16940 [Acidobacteria bacterium 13_1_20CM_3_53_8]
MCFECISTARVAARDRLRRLRGRCPYTYQNDSHCGGSLLPLRRPQLRIGFNFMRRAGAHVD